MGKSILNTRRSVSGFAVLTLYLLGVGLLTGPSLYQLLAGHLPAPKLELIPFADMVKVIGDPGSPGLGVTANLLGNVVMTLPFGFLLPVFWGWFGRMRRTVIAGLCLSVSIEAIQLIAGGVTSVDDVILNTLGTALGFLCAALLLRLAPGLRPKGEGRRAWAWPAASWAIVIVFYTVMDCMMLGGI